MDLCFLSTPEHYGYSHTIRSSEKIFSINQFFLPHQHRLNQNNQHVVTIESKSGLPLAFKGFFVQARAVKSNGTSNPLGSWDVSGSNGLAKVTLTKLYLI